MSQYFTVHPTHPQARLLRRAAEIVREGGLIVYPTDTTYALGCHAGDKRALERMRDVRRLDEHHHFTLTCKDLSEIAVYATVSNANYRILRHLTPGAFTFVLPATREVPRRLVHPKKRTIGLRVPDSPTVQGLLEETGELLVSTTMQLPDEELPMTDPEEIRERLERQVDLIIDGGTLGVVPSTILDMTGDTPVVTRDGLGVYDGPEG